MAKNLILWLIIATVLLTVFKQLDSPVSNQEIAYSRFISQVQEGQVKSVTISGANIIGEYSNGQRFETVRPGHDQKMLDDLFRNNVEVKGQKPEQQSIWTQLLVASFPILVIIAVFMFFKKSVS